MTGDRRMSSKGISLTRFRPSAQCLVMLWHDVGLDFVAVGTECCTLFVLTEIYEQEINYMLRCGFSHQPLVSKPSQLPLLSSSSATSTVLLTFQLFLGDEQCLISIACRNFVSCSGPSPDEFALSTFSPKATSTHSLLLDSLIISLNSILHIP